MLTLWRPSGLARWGRDFDELFRWAWGAEPSNGHSVSYAPAVDLEEHEGEFVLRADLPGVDQKEIEVKVHDGVLVLSGKREEATEQQDDTSYYRERRSGSFCRQFRLGDQVDAEQIAASYDKGVLTVTLPKKALAQPRQIPVKAS